MEDTKAHLPSPRTLVQTSVLDEPPWTPSLEEAKARLRCTPPLLAELRQGLLPCTRPAPKPTVRLCMTKAECGTDL